MKYGIEQASRSKSLFQLVKKQAYLLLVLFAFCSNAFAQPANDDPCNAIALPVAATCTYATYTNAAATASAGVPAPGCANYLGGDVWFTVVVPAGGAFKIDTQTGVITDGGMAIYQGTCTGLTLISCDDDSSPNGLMSQINASGLTPGAIIWVRFWEYGNNNNGTFGICVTLPPPPPANDDPCNAISLTATATCTYATYTNAGATPTAGVPAPGCANYLGGDIWFSVVVPAGGAFQVDTQTGVITDGGMAIYSGTCTGLTLISCDDDSSPNGLMPRLNASGLTPGATIWIRVWEYGNDNNGTFGICVTLPPPPPVNDEPCNAISLTATATCTYSTFTNAGATASAGVPAPGCANYLGGDVWFTVVVPSGGSLVFDTQTGVILDGGMAIYSGTCTGLTLISCDDDSSPNGLMPQINANGLTPGSTIWIRVWERGNDNNGTFGICVRIPPPPGPGDICTMANAFCSSNTYTFPNSTNVPSLGGGGIYGCLLTTPNPVWYFMQVQSAGSMAINIVQTSSTGAPLDVDFILWGPFTSLASGCSGISATNIVDCSYSISNTEIADIPNGIPGQFYILLITNFSNQPGSITFGQSGGTGSTNCAIVCNVTATNTGPVCSGSTFNLNANAVGNATGFAWTGPGGFTSNVQNPTGVIAQAAGPNTYTVVVTTPSATCSTTTVVTVNPKPLLGLDKTLLICPGSTGNLTALYTTTGLTTSWTLAGIPVANPAAITVAGVYRLIATNATNCSDTAFVTASINNLAVTASAANANCTSNGTVTVNASGGTLPYTYNINNGTYQASNIFSVVPGNYTATVKDSNG
ncbi:MAG TPA: SprB repeat-containing protein, partial [Ferruginibacter sp.]|nr:SprB repeat-containing protein [Ferruginibacter sp.]